MLSTPAALDGRFAAAPCAPCRFAGSTPADVAAWRATLLPKLRKCMLGGLLVPPPAPPAAAVIGGPCPLKVQTLSVVQCEAYEQRYIQYETREGTLVPAYLLVPHAPGPHPAVLCVAGHTPNGKADVAGIDGVASTELGAAYGRVLAEAGCVTLCPDNAGMGERRDADDAEGCVTTWRKLNMMGVDLTGFRCADLMRGVDLLESMLEVDSNRIGLAGLSGGCWLGLVLAALEPRIQACALSGFFTTFAQTNWVGHCVCHHPFGIGALCEMPDIAGLIAPRPIFVEWGEEDASRPLQPALDMVKEIYAAAATASEGGGTTGAKGGEGAGVHDGGGAAAVSSHVFAAGHMFHGGQSLPWLHETLLAVKIPPAAVEGADGSAKM